MNTKEIMEKRHALLEDLSGELNASEIAAILHQEEGAPEMVSAMLDEMGDGDMEITGDFFFRPLETEEDEVQYFISLFNIADEIPKDRLTDLFEAISYINFSLPAGNFNIDKDHRFLSFILSVPLPMGLEDEALFREMDLAVGNALAIADSYAGILSDVLNGKENAESVVEFLGGREK